MPTCRRCHLPIEDDRVHQGLMTCRLCELNIVPSKQKVKLTKRDYRTQIYKLMKYENVKTIEEAAKKLDRPVDEVRERMGIGSDVHR